ncbi:hypothetical protein GF373_17725 [bacterium]|nr:hypothetical protein [bacterium]
MTQISMPWGGTASGDATRAPYSAAEWAEMEEDLVGAEAQHGVCRSDEDDELEVTDGGANTATIGTGSAVVKGWWYKNTADVDLNVPDASIGSWRQDCIVVQLDVDDREVRLVRHENDTGENVNWTDAMLTQVDGDVWEIPLAIVEVDDAGALTIEDERRFINSFRRQRKILTPGAAAVDGASITLETSVTYRNVHIQFADGVTQRAGWWVDISDWSEDSDILVKFYLLNSVSSPPGDANDAYFFLRASQFQCGDGDSPIPYIAGKESNQTVSGDAAWSVFVISTLLDHDDFSKHCPLYISLSRYGGLPSDTSSNTWIMTSGVVQYRA